jgi:hypothetical protein
LAQQAATCPSSLHNPDGGGLMAMPYGLAPATVAPMQSTAPSGFVPRAGTPVVADLHVASTELGFQQGIAPAPEQTVGYRGLEGR